MKGPASSPWDAGNMPAPVQACARWHLTGLALTLGNHDGARLSRAQFRTSWRQPRACTCDRGGVAG